MSEGDIIQIKVNPDDLARTMRRLSQYEGPAFQRLVNSTVRRVLMPLAGAVRSAEESSGIVNRSDKHLRSIKAKAIRRRPFEMFAYEVGPTDAKRHLLIRGHRVVTRGGRDTGHRSRAFPYVAPVIEEHLGEYYGALVVALETFHE